jgi:hypothetical protein
MDCLVIDAKAGAAQQAQDCSSRGYQTTLLCQYHDGKRAFDVQTQTARTPARCAVVQDQGLA